GDRGDRDHGKPGALCRPQRQLPAGGVSEEDHAVAIELVPLYQLLRELDAARDVVARARPVAADVPDAAVLDVPRGDAGLRERHAQVAGVHEVVGRLPGTSVDHDRERPRPVAARHAEISELLWL